MQPSLADRAAQRSLSRWHLKLCGARREFRTSADDYIREDGTGSAAA